MKSVQWQINLMLDISNQLKNKPNSGEALAETSTITAETTANTLEPASKIPSNLVLAFALAPKIANKLIKDFREKNQKKTEQIDTLRKELSLQAFNLLNLIRQEGDPKNTMEAYISQTPAYEISGADDSVKSFLKEQSNLSSSAIIYLPASKINAFDFNALKTKPRGIRNLFASKAFSALALDAICDRAIGAIQNKENASSINKLLTQLFDKTHLKRLSAEQWGSLLAVSSETDQNKIISDAYEGRLKKFWFFEGRAKRQLIKSVDVAQMNFQSILTNEKEAATTEPGFTTPRRKVTPVHFISPNQVATIETSPQPSSSTNNAVVNPEQLLSALPRENNNIGQVAPEFFFSVCKSTTGDTPSHIKINRGLDALIDTPRKTLETPIRGKVMTPEILASIKRVSTLVDSNTDDLIVHAETLFSVERQPKHTVAPAPDNLFSVPPKTSHTVQPQILLSVTRDNGQTDEQASPNDNKIVKNTTEADSTVKRRTRKPRRRLSTENTQKNCRQTLYTANNAAHNNQSITGSAQLPIQCN